MTVTITNIIIIGAGGNVGRYIVSALDTDPRFTVSILARKSSRSAFPSHIPVHRVGDSYPEGELVQAFRGQDAVISTVSVGALQQQKLFIDAAIQARVKRFIPSEFGHDTRNEKAWDIFPQLTKTKAEIVTYLKSKENDRLEWSAFVTGPFFDLALGNFLGYPLVRPLATFSVIHSVFYEPIRLHTNNE